MKLLSILLIAVTLCVSAFGQSPIFSTDLPAEVAGKTDLWVARLDPTTAEPDGAIFMVQRQFLKRYAVARENGYPWSWAPLSAVFLQLDRKIPPANDELTAENQKRIREAVYLLSLELTATETGQK
jgi:hypothetical protein